MSAARRSASGRSCSQRIASRMRRSHSTVACRCATSASRTITLATADQGGADASRSSNGGSAEVLLEPLEAGLLLLVGQLDQPRQVARLGERELEVQLLAQRRHRGAGRHPVLEALEALGVAS